MQPCFVILMGVSGSGKTAVGRALAGRLGWEFFDADDYHPPANIEKMAGGAPLTDADRAPWLAVLHDLIAACLAQGRWGVLACSALRQSYRQALLEGNPGVQMVYLKGSYALIWSRMQQRAGHYMQPGMLRSQFDLLEEPQDAWLVEIDPPVEQIVEGLTRQIETA